MSPLFLSRAAARSPLAALLLLAPIALTVSGSAAASPLAAYGSYAEEDHSFEDHHGETLQSIDLSAADLTGSDFSAVNARNGRFVDAIAVGVLLAEAKLKDADFSGADLTNADLSDAEADATLFVGAVLDGALLVGADLKDADFSGATLLGADLSSVKHGDSATLTGAYFDAATQLDPAIDTSEMYYVVGDCPWDPEWMWVDANRDGNGDACREPRAMPEPGRAALFAGSLLLAALARRRCGSDVHGASLRRPAR